MLIEDQAEEAHPGLAGVVVQGAAQGVGIDHVELVRLVDRSLDGLRTGDGGEVEEGADRLREGDTQTASDVPSANTRAVMDPNSWTEQSGVAGDAYVDHPRRLLAEAPKRRGTAMTEHRPLSAREHRPHPSALSSHLGSPYDIDTGSHYMQSPTAQAVTNRISREAKLQQLPTTDHPMLP